MSTEPRPPVSLNDARERAVQSLSTHFANDALTLEELERRIELAYRAKNVAELQALTSDLDAAAGAGRVPAPPGAAPRPYAAGAGRRRYPVDAMAATRDRIVGIMSETHRVGNWPVPQRLDVRLIMANSKIDLTQSALPPVLELDVRAIMSSLHVLVPVGVHVVNHMGAFMGAVRVDTGAPIAIPPGAPVVRLTGGAVMSEVKVEAR